MSDKLIFKQYLGLETVFFSTENKNEYIRYVTQKLEKNCLRFLNNNRLSLGNMSTLQRYGSLLIKLSTDFYCPIYIKYHPDIHLFVFGIETDMLHMDVKKYPEWQEVLETNSIEVGITSNETFELEFKTNEIFDAPVEAVDNE